MNPIKNSTYSVATGLTITQGSTANRTQTLVAGEIKNRLTGINTVIAGGGTTTLAAPSANKRRVDTVVYETLSGSTGITSVTGTPFDYNLAVTSITASTPIAGQFTVVTTLNHNLSAGEAVTISGVTTTTAYNGTFTVASVPSDNSFVITSTTTGTAVVTSAKVLNYAVAKVDSLPSATQIALALVGVNYDGTTVSTDTPVDVRSTPTYQALRAFNRSQNVRIGGKKVTPSDLTFVDLDDPRAFKEFAYHSSIGAVYPVDGLSDTITPVVVNYGGIVSTPAAMSGLSAVVVTVSAGELLSRDVHVYNALNGTGSTTNTSANGIAYTASTSFASALDSTNDTGYILVYADAYSGTVGVVKSVVAPLASAVIPSTPVNGVPLALITASYAASNGTTVVKDLRPRA
jgi:hypothetical protein